MGGILSVRSGIPFTPQVNVRDNRFLFAATRPNLTSGHSSNPTAGVTAGCGYNSTTGKWTVEPGRKLGGADLYFDPCAFESPALGTMGNIGRNTIISPRVLTMDASWQRDFLLDSKRRLQFRLEVFNLPNHRNFGSIEGGPQTVFSGETATRNSTAGRLGRTATTSRQIQLALRFSF